MKRLLILLFCALSASAYAQQVTNDGPHRSFVSDRGIRSAAVALQTGVYDTTAVNSFVARYYPQVRKDGLLALQGNSFYWYSGGAWRTASGAATIAGIAGLQAALDAKAPASGSANYIQNNNTGTAQSAVLNISGAGIFSGGLAVISPGVAQGITVSGSDNPAFGILQTNGTTRGYIAMPTTAGVYFSDAASGDVAIRTETGSLLLGPEGAGSTIKLNQAGHVQINGLPVHADNAAAVAAGRPVGTLYRNGDVLQVVH
jgi:hypothetical protein